MDRGENPEQRAYKVVLKIPIMSISKAMGRWHVHIGPYATVQVPSLPNGTRP